MLFLQNYLSNQKPLMQQPKLFTAAYRVNQYILLSFWFFTVLCTNASCWCLGSKLCMTWNTQFLPLIEILLTPHSLNCLRDPRYISNNLSRFMKNSSWKAKKATKMGPLFKPIQHYFKPINWNPPSQNQNMISLNISPQQHSSCLNLPVALAATLSLNWWFSITTNITQSVYVAG